MSPHTAAQSCLGALSMVTQKALSDPYLMASMESAIAQAVNEALERAAIIAEAPLNDESFFCCIEQSQGVAKAIRELKSKGDTQ